MEFNWSFQSQKEENQYYDQVLWLVKFGDDTESLLLWQFPWNQQCLKMTKLLHINHIQSVWKSLKLSYIIHSFMIDSFIFIFHSDSGSWRKYFFASISYEKMHHFRMAKDEIAVKLQKENNSWYWLDFEVLSSIINDATWREFSKWIGNEK